MRNGPRWCRPSAKSSRTRPETDSVPAYPETDSATQIQERKVPHSSVRPAGSPVKTGETNGQVAPSLQHPE